ncbi:DUF2065 family protein [Candidatus Halocynthiibacter alkanivorans]|jgi:uncharacterized protein|uniref:DUF2065 family protein n=1 Tax=Candidatus Halocynthiibacter alkanivorans TaxID=2267619 RepID=UPI000B586728|nr:DUF2065 family protein [Candidatus Halocynthiibacter alkanivorans]OUS35160.1 hypothetical protein A9Q94_13600 [Rhodobacterales bacterium 56_14_T64]
MAWILLALGLVLIVEGLVFALAPFRFDELLRLLADMPLQTRRLIGLAALAAGVLLVAISRYAGL